jgi:RluA family pseudouridine synthase
MDLSNHDEPNGSEADDVEDRPVAADDLRTMAGWVRWGRTIIEPHEGGARLDRYLARRFTYRSRTGWVAKIREGKLRVGGRKVRPSYILRAGDLIEYRAPPLPEPAVDTNCPILYEDDALLAVNKSGNIPVHPSGRYFLHTVLHVLGRERSAGWLRVVHRLDRETSGVLVFAKSLSAAQRLARQFEDRLVHKSYLAVVWGDLTRECEIDRPLGRGSMSTVRKAMAVVPDGRPSRTIVRPLSGGRDVTLVEARPLTGRLHQIRVHLKSIGHPIVGDKLYGQDEGIFLKFLKGHSLTEGEYQRLGSRRQALHSWKLALKHPADDRAMEIRAALPEDFRTLTKERGLDITPLAIGGASPVTWGEGNMDSTSDSGGRA